MIPSIVLRRILSQIYDLDLNTYKWSNELEKEILSIKFKDAGRDLTLRTIYENGINIGNCLLTSHIISNVLSNLLIVTGKVEILKGTKNSKLGDHVWLEDDNNMYDPTLMITVPKNSCLAKYYLTENTISKSAISSDITYCDEFYLLKYCPDIYYEGVFKIMR